MLDIRKIIKNLTQSITLSIYLAFSDFKVRNERSYLGILWYLLDPIILFAILISIRSQIIIEQPTFYPVYLFIGLIMFNFFRRATTSAVSSISGNGGYVKNMNISKEAIVVSKVLEAAYSHIIEIVCLAGLLVWYHLSVLNLIYYVPIFIIFLIFTIGVSLFLATMGVFVGDMQNIWPVLLQIVWFLTPIFYSVTPGTASGIWNSVNPLYYFMDTARSVVINIGEFNGMNFLIITSSAIISILLGLVVFRKWKMRFAEFI